MYSKEQQVWAERLAALQSKQNSQTQSHRWAAPQSVPAYIPAYVPGKATAQHPAADPDFQEQAAQHPHTALAVRATPTADAIVSAAQVEALKLQVAQLRRANLDLQQQLAGAGAERAAAAKQRALEQLAAMQVAAPPASPTKAAVRNPAGAAAVAALQQDLGVDLPADAEAVPLLYLQQLHATYQRRLAELQQQHADTLQRRLEETDAQRRRQVEQHAQEVQLLTEGLQDPTREAEVQLLRDDCKYLKDKVQQLGAEYGRRVQVAAAEARLTAQREAAEQRRQWESAAAAEQQASEQQQSRSKAAVEAAAAAAEDATALERARHAAELARLREQHTAELGRLRAESAAALEQREAQYAQMLGELRALRASMSAAPSRASTRQEERPDGPAGGGGRWEPGAAAQGPCQGGWPAGTGQQQPQQLPQGAAQCLGGWPAGTGQQPPQPLQAQHRSPVPAPGQLMELWSDEEEEQPRHGRPLQQATTQGAGWEQPRHPPQMLQHWHAAQEQLPQAGKGGKR